MAKLGSGQQLSFGTGFSDPDISSFKLVEVDDAMLSYLQKGGSLEIKGQGAGDDVTACTADATYTVTLVESSNTVLLMQDNERYAEASSAVALAPGARPDCKYTVLGSAPGVLELRRVAPPLHLVRDALASSNLDADALSRYRAQLHARAAGGAPAKRARTADETGAAAASAVAGPQSEPSLGVRMGALLETVPCSGAEMSLCLERLQAVRVPGAYLAFQARAAAAVERGSVEPDAEAEDDDDADAEAAAAAQLQGSGAGAASATPAGSSASAGTTSPCRWLYEGAHTTDPTSTAACWALVDDDFAFAALQAILRTAALNRWRLDAIPVTEAADQLSLSFPRFIVRHALTVLFGRPSGVDAGGGAGAGGVLAALHFAPVARAKGLRALMALQLEATTVAAAAGGGTSSGAAAGGAGAGAGAAAASASGMIVGLKRSLSAVHAAASGRPGAGAGAARRTAGSDDEDEADSATGEDTADALLDLGVSSEGSSASTSASSSGAAAPSGPSLLSRFLAVRSAATAASGMPPAALVAALLRQQAVRVEAFMAAWQRALPASMRLSPEDGGSAGAGSASASASSSPSTQAHMGRLDVSLLDGLVLVETPAAAAAAGAGGAGAGAAAAVAAGIASASSWPGAAAPSATIRLFPEHILSPDPAARFKQLFAARPKWRLPELTPFLRPVAGSKATAAAPAVPGKTIDELLLAFSRVTNVAGGDRLFSAR